MEERVNAEGVRRRERGSFKDEEEAYVDGERVEAGGSRCAGGGVLTAGEGTEKMTFSSLSGGPCISFHWMSLAREEKERMLPAGVQGS